MTGMAKLDLAEITDIQKKMIRMLKTRENLRSAYRNHSFKKLRAKTFKRRENC